MTAINLPGPSPYDSDSGVEDMLEYYEYIHAVARRYILSNIGPADYEDIAQEAFIKLMLMAKKQPIQSPKAYIRRIVHTVAVDMARKFKPNLYQGFPIGEDGEIQEDELPGAEMDNPETILEEKEAVEERMQELAVAIATFRPRQKHAAVCVLKDRVDNLIQFIDALHENGVDNELQWPMAKSERQLLLASYSPAKRKIAQSMNIPLNDY